MLVNNGKVGLSPPDDPLIMELQRKLNEMGYETMGFKSDEEIDRLVRDPLYGED